MSFLRKPGCGGALAEPGHLRAGSGPPGARPGPARAHAARRKGAHALARLAAAAALLAPAVAAASSTAEMLGAPTSANSLGARLLSHGADATYFNPALLPASSPNLEIGFFTLHTSAQIRLRPRPAGVDVPSSIYQADLPPDDSGTITRPFATADLPQPRRDTDESQTTTFAALGLVRPLIDDQLVFGFWALLPVGSLIQTHGFFPDEREQYFSNRLHLERHGDRLKMSSFSVALGSQLNRWLSLGAGLAIGISTRTSMTVYMPNAGDQSVVLLAPEIDSESDFAPYLAAAGRFFNGRLVSTLTVHFPQWGSTEGANQIRLWRPSSGENAVVQRYTFTQGFEPLRVGLGAAWNATARNDGRFPWQVGLQTVFERWSTYLDRHSERPPDAWRDSFAVVASGAISLGPRRLAADLAWYPSPVPPQSGRTNYVDCDRAALVVAYQAPFELFGSEVEAGVYVRGDLLLPRTEAKDPARMRDEVPDQTVDLATQKPLAEWQGLQTNNPGFPGYSARGYSLGAGVSLRVSR